MNGNPLNSATQLDSISDDRSALVWLTTDATRAAITNVGLSDNGHVGMAQAYAPSSRPFFCPEPASLVLGVIAGMAGVGFVWRRKTRQVVHLQQGDERAQRCLKASRLRRNCNSVSVPTGAATNSRRSAPRCRRQIMRAWKARA